MREQAKTGDILCSKELLRARRNFGRNKMAHNLFWGLIWAAEIYPETFPKVHAQGAGDLMRTWRERTGAGGDFYQALKKSIAIMRDATIEIEDEEAFQIFTRLEYDKGIIEAEFNSRIAPHLMLSIDGRVA